jgi:CheY-like chemotaxis protein
MAETPYRVGRTILVVEDEASVRNVLRVLQRRVRDTVLEAGDGAEGLTLSPNFNGQIELLISDVRMPKMDGPATARHLHTEGPGINALFISSCSTSPGRMV